MVRPAKRSAAAGLALWLSHRIIPLSSYHKQAVLAFGVYHGVASPPHESIITLHRVKGAIVPAKNSMSEGEASALAASTAQPKAT